MGGSEIHGWVETAELTGAPGPAGADSVIVIVVGELKGSRGWG